MEYIKTDDGNLGTIVCVDLGNIINEESRLLLQLSDIQNRLTEIDTIKQKAIELGIGLPEQK